MTFAHLSDDHLAAAAAAALDRAHNAPRSLPGEMGEIIDGNSSTNANDTWARASREWMALADEIDRRKAKAA